MMADMSDNIFDQTILSTAPYKKRIKFIDNIPLPASLILSSWGFLLEPIALYACAKILGIDFMMKQGVHHGFFSINSAQISVQDTRQLIDFFSKSAIGNRVALIKDPEKMTHNASNALLKTIEEPPLNAFIILYTNHINTLSDTLRSRCVKLEILAFTRAEFREILEFLTTSSEKAYQIICDLIYPDAELAIKILSNLDSNFIEENLKNVQDISLIIKSLFDKSVDLLNNEKITILIAIIHRVYLASVTTRQIDNLYKAREILINYDRFNLDLESALNYISMKVCL